MLFLRLLYYRYCNDSLTNTNEREVCFGSDAADFASLLFGSFAFRNSNFDLDFGLFWAGSFILLRILIAVCYLLLLFLFR